MGSFPATRGSAGSGERVRATASEPGWLRSAILALLAIGCCAPAVADRPRISAKLHLVAEYHRPDNHGPFRLPGNLGAFSSRIGREELEIGSAWKGFDALATLRRETADGRADGQVVLNELYWDGDWLGQDLSIGKKVHAFGVGFGYRPLDVLQRENRRRLYPNTLEGIPTFAWQTYGATSAWSLIYANPGHGRDEADRERDDESITLKHYRLLDDSDLHALLRLSERHRAELGIGLARALGDHWEIHGSLLYQRRGEQPVNPLAGKTGLPLAESDPVIPRPITHVIEALGGASWTSDTGWTLLAEVWYDGAAYRAGQWRELAALTKAQRALLGAPGLPASAVRANIAASTRIFARNNLLRWNGLLRFSYDGERLDPSIELLFTPEDGGYVATLNAEYRLERHLLRLSLRAFGGPQDAAYRLLPEDWVVQLAWEWTWR